MRYVFYICYFKLSSRLVLNFCKVSFVISKKNELSIYITQKMRQSCEKIITYLSSINSKTNFFKK